MTVRGWKKLFTLKKANPVKPKVDDYDAKHRKTLDSLLPYAKGKAQSNLTEVKYDYVTRSSSIVFAILPEWAINFPPYNVARLAAITKEAGYKTYAFDLNAKAHTVHETWGLDYDPWDGFRDWKWKEAYHEELHSHLEPLMNEYLDKIVAINPTVVGFSLYYCNELPTKWMAKELKKRLPNVIIMIGGPQAHQSYWKPEPEYDIVISGEGEKMLMETLEKIEDGWRPTELAWFKQEEGQRLDLDSLPPPNYDFFDFSDYGFPNGVNAELSRGCTAKCVFCSETHYWKYRGRQARNILEEVADLYYEKGVDVVWFLDSLVNGNLKELRAFAKGVVEKGMKIHWTGYARCDGRMDLEYYKDLAASGCISLSYGIESGSTKVLADMNKGVTVEEIEQNLKHGAEVGIEAFTNWIIGFPTEETQHFYESLMLIWRNRNNNLTDIAGGFTYVMAPDTIIGQNARRFGIADAYFEENWIREDLTNCKIHRLIRLKTFNILLNNLVNDADTDFTNRPGINKSYTLSKLRDIKEIEFEDFDFNICTTSKGRFADSIVNEVWPILRLLWRSRGAYSIELNFSPELDLNEFGNRLAANFTSKILFSITDDGEWDADFTYEFKQSESAWKYNNYSQAESMAATRARRLAIPGSEGVAQWDGEAYDAALLNVNKMNTEDLSFDYTFVSKGKW